MFCIDKICKRCSKTFDVSNFGLDKRSGSRQPNCISCTKAMTAAKISKRRSTKLQATPSWADQEQIKKVYEACEFLNMVTGEWHNVDHIVPLQHPLVCGLHVADNLQILTRTDNCIKHNKFDI